MYRTNSAQVLRYSALIFGVLYGFQHQRSITSQTKAAHAQAEYQHKSDLIQKAKLEWAKKTLPPESKTASGDGALLLCAFPIMRG
jgi:F-type H+-transporting ATP synthase subunit e